MKKFLLAFLAVLCLVCASVAIGACNSSKYYLLYFSPDDGVIIDCEIPSGYEVRKGYKVVFKVELEDGAEGEPVVEANGVALKGSNAGYYSFRMKGETTVRVTGVQSAGGSTVIFDKGSTDGTEYRITYNAEYVDENNKVVTIDTENRDGTPLPRGTEISFDIGVSVYYGENPEYTVLADTQIIQPDDNGKYHTTISRRTTITVQGLQLDKTFVEREDGSGTRENPFRLRRPIDLYMMSTLVNGSIYYSQVSTAYYRLEEDIDLKGEELFIIGISDEYYFAGDFDGNGHTIKNYYISATAVDQDDYSTGFMPNIGLFGVAAFAQIYDLNIEGFKCEVDGSPWDNDEHKDDYQGFIVGGIAAYAVGVNITNCSVSGEIIATAGDNRFGYVGGIAGYLASAYNNQTATRYYSTVRSCSSDMYIEGRAGVVYAAGGIAGYVTSYDEKTPSMIINSYTVGEVGGAMRSGGIAGIVASYSSVTNCYTSGYVAANARVRNDANYGDNRYAYAGGIAGELQPDAVIANCFLANGAQSAVTATALAGSRFALSGDIAGIEQNGGIYIQAAKGLVYNCASARTETINDNYIKTELGWVDGDWTFNGNGRPTVNAGDGSNSFAITVNLNDGAQIHGSAALTQNVEDAYMPMSYWFLTSDNLSEFLTDDNGNRSYGYYFDNGLQNKVPQSYVPTGDVELYVGFADYSEIAGVYYLQISGQNGSGRYLELRDDGVLVYRDGAIKSETYYYYDGTTATLCDTYLSVMGGNTDAYASFKAQKTADGKGLTIWDLNYYPVTAPLTAVKEIENFVYGKYYGTGVEYTFNADGTGAFNGQAFTYEVDGANLEITLNNSPVSGTVAGNKVISAGGVNLTPFHEFAGEWEISAGLHKVYKFDGKGNWVYEYYGHKDGNVILKGSDNGTYTVSGSVITLTGKGVSFTFENGCLKSNGEVYFYKEYSYAGTWNNLAKIEAVELVLKGVTSAGCGDAYINYGGNNGAYDVTYEEKNGKIYVYNNDFRIAVLEFSRDELTLSGKIFNINSGEEEEITFYLYDDFKGEWISDGMDVTFNGLGNYNVEGNNDFLPASGTVTVNGADLPNGTYTLTDNTLTGKFVYNGDEYTISYDEVNKQIAVTGSTNFTLQPRDAWYHIKLTDGTYIYSFDGKSALTGGGVMTKTNISDGTSTTETGYKTKVSVSGTDYKLNGNTVYLYTEFTGTWKIAGTYGQTLTIPQFNATNTASGTYDGSACVFTYYPNGNYITITDPADEKALPLYITALTNGTVTELGIGTENDAAAFIVVCTQAADDDYKGNYAYDGGVLTLDGLGNSAFADGSAKYVKDNKVVEEYTYTIDEFGQVLLLSASRGLYTVFYENDEGGYEKGGKHYANVLPDNLYTVKAVTADGTEYSFLGNGIAKDDNGNEYTYSDLKQDATRNEYTLTITDGSGTSKVYVLDYGKAAGEDYTLTVKND
ncbi:MAG: hypothetical protein K2N22_03265 [Clostridia bacterium]|nr:hypothetical protein [Clostridia bacterium]